MTWSPEEGQVSSALTSSLYLAIPLEEVMGSRRSRSLSKIQVQLGIAPPPAVVPQPKAAIQVLFAHKH